MNLVMIAISTQMTRGLEGIRECLKTLTILDVQRVSSVYRRRDQQTDGTLSSEVVVALAALTEMRLLDLQNFLKKQNEGLTFSKWLLLSYNDEVRLDPEAPIPHPLLHFDPLVLRCAAEIQGSFEHPVLGRSLQELVRSSTRVPDEGSDEFLARGESLLEI